MDVGGEFTLLSLSVNEYKGLQESIGHAVDVRPFSVQKNLLHQYLKWRQGEEITDTAEKIFANSILSVQEKTTGQTFT